MSAVIYNLVTEVLHSKHFCACMLWRHSNLFAHYIIEIHFTQMWLLFNIHAGGKLTPSQQRKVYTCTGDSIQLTKFQQSAQPTDSSQPPLTDSGHQTASKSVRKSHLSLEVSSYKFRSYF